MTITKCLTGKELSAINSLCKRIFCISLPTAKTMYQPHRSPFLTKSDPRPSPQGSSGSCQSKVQDANLLKLLYSF
jgi:hypothetical protein